MAVPKKVHLVSGKNIRLTDETLHWHRTGKEKRRKVHVYQHPNLIDPNLTHSKTLCGIQVHTSDIGIPVAIDNFDVCEMCLGGLKRDFPDSFEEVQHE